MEWLVAALVTVSAVRDPGTVATTGHPNRQYRMQHSSAVANQMFFILISLHKNVFHPIL